MGLLLRLFLRRCEWPRRSAALFQPAQAQLLAGHPDFLQVPLDFFGHAFGQIDQAVVVEDFDAADVPAVHLRLVGDGADDVGGLHAMLMADLDAIGLHAGLGSPSRPARPLVRGQGR